MKTDNLVKWIKRGDISAKTTLRYCDGRLAEKESEAKDEKKRFYQTK